MRNEGAEFQRGFAYAIKMLMRGTEPAEIEKFLLDYNGGNLRVRDHYTEGALKALTQWHARQHHH